MHGGGLVVVMGFRWCSLMTVALMLYYSLLKPEGLRFLTHNFSHTKRSIQPHDLVFMSVFKPTVVMLSRMQSLHRWTYFLITGDNVNPQEAVSVRMILSLKVLG